MLCINTMHRMMIIIHLALALLLGSLSLGWAQQDTTNLADSLIARLDQIEATLSRDSLSDQTYTDLRTELTQITKEATDQKQILQPQLQDAQARLNALKPAESTETTDKSNETEELTTRRQEIETKLTEIDGKLKLVSSTLVRIEQLNNRITLARQERFTNRLMERSNTILDPTLWVKGLTGLATTWHVSATLFSDWGSFLATKVADQAWQLVTMLVFVILLIFGPLRYLLFSGLSKLASLEAPTPLQRSFFAAWAVMVYTLFPVAIFWTVILILSNAGLLPTRIETLFSRLLFVLFCASISYGLTRVLLAPNRPNYRLLRIETGDAQKLFSLAMALLATFMIQMLFDEVDEILFAPLETTIFINGAASVLIAILVSLGLRLIIRTQTDQEPSPHPLTEISQHGFTLPRFIHFLQPLIWLICIVISAAPILGYVSLGSFVAEQLGRLFVILALLGILSALIDNFLMEYLDRADTRKVGLSKTIGIAPSAIDQLSVLLNGVLRVLLYVGAALMVFTPWGVESDDFLTALKNAVFSIKLGDLTISPINILGALVVFIIAIALLKSVERWIEQRWLPATNLDTGLKSSIETSLGYLGFIIAAMLAFSYMGIDLSNIALVAGALSVGIGFGLQSIVNNFVSGLILLVERPIKTGDWVVVGSDQGYVKKISVRATKIETFDRATVVVPNSELISNRMMNWMHNGSIGRIIIPVGVSYDANPEQIREILMKAAEESEFVTSYPAPIVYFMDFGASSLDFELRCYIHDINSSLAAKSALRFEIFRTLKEANIEIPFPQRDVHVRSISLPEGKQASDILPQQKKPKAATKQKKNVKNDEVDIEDMPSAEQDNAGTEGAANSAES
ncbi:DUF3772 domain-containing protein [uncultured Cohaesibacter sp.]|uniref:mechanosensitive ion channel family protein n=1 Tax=uncultured Cohaesibacter sp. TaxID=1002546 RepID=UPI0029316862|nr:DUF3772 domain-containing protein [uncultured Cohaesibacter sp.]